MYKNVFYDAWNDRMHIWEVINGKKFYDKIDVDYEYYVKDDTRQSDIKDIFGVPVIKRITNNKKAMREFASSGVYCCETDISEDIKFLQKRYGDSDIKTDVSDFNICYLDIEIAFEDRFPNPQAAEFPINLVTMKFSKSNKIYTF